MADLNVTAHTGNLTRDVELRYTQGGKAVCDIGLAVSGGKDEVDFFDVTLFGQSAEYLAEYAKKGDKISVEGRLKLDQWEKDGQKRSKVHIIGNRVSIISSKGGKKPEEAPKEEVGQGKNKGPEDGDDVPF